MRRGAFAPDRGVKISFPQMLTAVRRLDGQKVVAWEADKAERPFLCPACRETVTLRKGGVKAAHFAHQPPVVCEYGQGESEEHRLCKTAIYEGLVNHPHVTKCEMERDLGTVRPDVSAYVGRVAVAFEVQLSSLPLEKIVRRTAEYARKGIHVLWLPLYSEALRRELYRPKTWELWLHAAYFGEAYYWVGGTRALPVRFRDFYTEVRGRTRDYHKLSPMKVPLAGRPLDLAEGFRPLSVGARSFEGTLIPAAKLMVSR